MLLFPTARPFSLAASSDDTWDFTINNQLQLPGAVELRLGYIYYDFAVRTDVEGEEFTALYENLLETQVATVGMRIRF